MFWRRTTPGHMQYQFTCKRQHYLENWSIQYMFCVCVVQLKDTSQLTLRVEFIFFTGYLEITPIKGISLSWIFYFLHHLFKAAGTNPNLDTDNASRTSNLETFLNSQIKGSYVMFRSVIKWIMNQIYYSHYCINNCYQGFIHHFIQNKFNRVFRITL